MGALLALASYAGGACGSDSTAEDDELEAQVCQQADLGELFVEQASATFRPADLADVAPDADERLPALREAGLIRGHFVFWKEAIGRPPFESPVNVVCQALEFRSSEQAEAFAAGLRATPRDLASAALTWLPEGERTAIEGANYREGVRVFGLTAEDDATSIEVTVVVAGAGRYVRSIYAGGQSGPVAAADVLAVLERIRTRQ